VKPARVGGIDLRACDRAGKLPRLAKVEPLERNAFQLLEGGRSRRRTSPRPDHDDERDPLRHSNDLLDQGLARLVDPVDVVDDDDPRPVDLDEPLDVAGRERAHCGGDGGRFRRGE
jgi:hypothetical protein